MDCACLIPEPHPTGIQSQTLSKEAWQECHNFSSASTTHCHWSPLTENFRRWRFGNVEESLNGRMLLYSHSLHLMRLRCNNYVCCGGSSRSSAKRSHNVCLSLHHARHIDVQALIARGRRRVKSPALYFRLLHCLRVMSKLDTVQHVSKAYSNGTSRSLWLYVLPEPQAALMLGKMAIDGFLRPEFIYCRPSRSFVLALALSTFFRDYHTHCIFYCSPWMPSGYQALSLAQSKPESGRRAMYQIWRILILAAVYKARTVSATATEAATSPHTDETISPRVDINANITGSPIRSAGAFFPFPLDPFVSEPSFVWHRALEGDAIDHLTLSMGQSLRPTVHTTVHQSDLTTHSSPTRVEAFGNNANHASSTLNVPGITSIQDRLVPRKLMVAITARGTGVQPVGGIDAHPATVLSI